MVTFQDYINHLKTSRIRKPLVKLEILRSEDETPVREVISELKTGGSLNESEKNGVRKSLSLEVDNSSKEFFPSLDSRIWVGQKAKLYVGYEINGENYFIPKGIFVYDNPTVNDDLSVDINMVDKFSLIDGSIAGTLDKILIIPISTTLGNALRTMMTISQDSKPIVIDTDLDSQVIPYQIIIEEGEPLGDGIIKLAEAFSCNVYYNDNGNLVFEKDIEDSSKGSVWEFNADSVDEINYVGGNIQQNFDKVKNAITVIGDNIAGQTFRFTLKNEDLLSDTSIPNLGVEILEVIKDDIIYSTALCEQRCIYELRRKTNVNLSGRIDSIALPHIKEGDVITLTDSRLNLFKKRLLVDSINTSLDSGFEMSLSLLDVFDANI